jgi:hypothetical protein
LDCNEAIRSLKLCEYLPSSYQIKSLVESHQKVNATLIDHPRCRHVARASRAASQVTQALRPLHKMDQKCEKMQNCGPTLIIAAWYPQLACVLLQSVVEGTKRK